MVNLERAIGRNVDWTTLTAIIIQMVGSHYNQLLRYSALAFDYLHDLLCKHYPNHDDAIRYTEDINNG